MGIFKSKEKVDLDQFIADVISFSLENLDQNFEKMILSCDEYQIADAKFKKIVYDTAPDLIISDIIFECVNDLSKIVSPDDLSSKITDIYARYLQEYKKLSWATVVERDNSLTAFGNKLEETLTARRKSEEYAASIGHNMQKLSSHEDIQLGLCSTFAKICEGEDKNTIEGKSFAAFKFAMGLVKADIVKLYLKERSIQL